MGFIVTVAQQKGGAGKTTVAAQLAGAFRARGVRVATIDTDPQGSLAQWAAARRAALPDEPDYDHVSGAGYRGVSEARSLKRKFDIVVIDTPPHSESATRLAVQNADLVLVPLQLSPFDLSATGATAELIGSARKPVLFMFNRTPPRAKIADQIRAEFLELGLPLAEASFGARAAYVEAAAAGRSVAETSRRSAAGTETRALAREVLQIAGLEDASSTEAADGAVKAA